MASDRAAYDDAIYDDGVLRITHLGSPRVLALAGEIDESNYRGLTDALGQIAGEHREIHFDLAGLRYCDLAGLRAIVRLAGGASTDGRASGPDGRRVVLHAVPRQLKTVLSILGWDSSVGLAVEGQASGTEEQAGGPEEQISGAGPPSLRPASATRSSASPAAW